MTPIVALAAGGGIRWRTLADARQEAALSERPLLVLGVRGLDHWSARWLAELGHDGDAVRLVNEGFVPALVEVDRDPATARVLQQVLALTADAAGWPALALALPDGRWVGASPWRPVRDQDRTAGTVRLLAEAAPALLDGSAVQDATRLAAMLAQVQVQPRTALPDPTLYFDSLESHALAVADTLEGGFGPPPRRSDPALLGLLAARAARSDAPLAVSAQVERTLAALCAGALHDHLGGGFFRACSDAAWRVPLCEQRSRDTALLIPLLRDQGLAPIADQATAWLINACRRSDGLFAHGFHADSPAGAGRWEEGAYHRWSAPQIAGIVGEAGAELLARRFDLGEAEGFPAIRGQLDPAGTRRLPELVHRLAVAQRERTPPARDDTAFAADQGMVLMALAGSSDRPASAARSALLAAIGGAPAWWEADGTPLGTADGRAAAWLARGLQACGEPARAGRLAEAALASWLDPADDEDGPSPAAVAAHACADLGWRERGLELVAVHAHSLRTAPLACAGLAHAWLRLL
jgi:uncharacterized protein YyaL (SSP411 family)